MPVGDVQPVELLADGAAWKDEPARLARQFGHQPAWDPGTQQRWTCNRCGRAVLRVGTNIYGSAVRERCDSTNI
jgi:hypothetical protein